MGYIKDEHWIIEGEAKALKKLRVDIIKELEKEFDTPMEFGSYISPVLYGPANGYCCLFLPADGSKEGWETSNNLDEVRERIREKIYHHNAVKNSHIGIIQVTDDEGTGLSVERLTRGCNDG